MSIISATFWVAEVAPLWKHIQNLPKRKWRRNIWGLIINPFIAIGYIIDLLMAIPKGFYFYVDVAATVTLTGIFGLGGVIGTAMGLTISNVFSVALWQAKKRNASMIK